jgi:phosphate butyryltransferase
MIKTLEDLLAKAKALGPKRCVVAGGEDEASLEALAEAAQQKIARGILFGDKAAIETIAKNLNIPLKDFEIFNEPDPKRATAGAVQFVREKGDFLLKGQVSTSIFLKGVLDKEIGLRTGRILSHVAILEVKTYPKLLLVTDGGMNIKPDLAMKADIINNAIELARFLGIEKPRVALLAAVETVNPDMPETLDWAELAKMAERGQIKNALIEGPLALDLAVSKEAAKIKKIKSEVAGEADIFVVPDIAAGNIFAKGLIYLAEAKICGIVMGAQKPVVMLSRADTPETKLYSIALGGVSS